MHVLRQLPTHPKSPNLFEFAEPWLFEKVSIRFSGDDAPDLEPISVATRIHRLSDVELFGPGVMLTEIESAAARANIVHGECLNIVGKVWSTKIDMLDEMTRMHTISVYIDTLFCPSGCCRLQVLRTGPVRLLLDGLLWGRGRSLHGRPFTIFKGIWTKEEAALIYEWYGFTKHGASAYEDQDPDAQSKAKEEDAAENEDRNDDDEDNGSGSDKENEDDDDWEAEDVEAYDNEGACESCNGISNADGAQHVIDDTLASIPEEVSEHSTTEGVEARDDLAPALDERNNINNDDGEDGNEDVENEDYGIEDETGDSSEWTDDSRDDEDGEEDFSVGEEPHDRQNEFTRGHYFIENRPLLPVENLNFSEQEQEEIMSMPEAQRDYIVAERAHIISQVECQGLRSQRDEKRISNDGET